MRCATSTAAAICSRFAWSECRVSAGARSSCDRTSNTLSAPAPSASSVVLASRSFSFSGDWGSASRLFSTEAAAALKRSRNWLDQGRIVDVRRFGEQARHQIASARSGQERLQGAHPALDQICDRLLALGRHLLAGGHQVEAASSTKGSRAFWNLACSDREIGDRRLPLRAQSQALLDGGVERFRARCDLTFDVDQIGDPFPRPRPSPSGPRSRR